MELRGRGRKEREEARPRPSETLKPGQVQETISLDNLPLSELERLAREAPAVLAERQQAGQGGGSKSERKAEKAAVVKAAIESVPKSATNEEKKAAVESALERWRRNPTMTTCADCGGSTPAGLPFCQNCGKPLPEAAPAEAEGAPAVVPAPEVPPVPPVDKPGTAEGTADAIVEAKAESKAVGDLQSEALSKFAKEYAKAIKAAAKAAKEPAEKQAVRIAGLRFGVYAWLASRGAWGEEDDELAREVARVAGERAGDAF